MEDKEYRLKDFMAITETSPTTAKNFMSNSEYQIDIAVNAFYEQYAPIATASSEEFPETLIEIDEIGNFVQKRGKKRSSDSHEPLIISSDEEEEVVFVSEQVAKVPKLELPGCSNLFIKELPGYAQKTRDIPGCSIRNKPGNSSAYFGFPDRPNPFLGVLEFSNAFNKNPGCSKSVAAKPPSPKKVMRKILIDGSNVAVTYAKSLLGTDYNKTKRDAFSVEGLEICVKYFKDKGFDVRAIVPEFRLNVDRSSNCRLIRKMKEEGILVATPAKSYDDGILLEGALRTNAAVVSNDFFRECLIDFIFFNLIELFLTFSRAILGDFKGKGFDDVINSRIIRFNFLFNELIIAEDPYGRNGPKLNDILYSTN
jgi:hypothetical protein